MPSFKACRPGSEQETREAMLDHALQHPLPGQIPRDGNGNVLRCSCPNGYARNRCRCFLVGRNFALPR